MQRSLLSPWTTRWNLTDDWCIGWVATHKIGRWYEANQSTIEGAPRLEIAEVRPRRFEIYPLVMPGWSPIEKTKDDFKAEIRLGLESALEAYCSQTEQRIQSVRTWSNEANQPAPHYIRTPELGQPEHFRWLIAYQLYRASFKPIADLVSIDRHAVQLAIKGLASKMGLTQRPSGDYCSKSSLALKALLTGA